MLIKKFVPFLVFSFLSLHLCLHADETAPVSAPALTQDFKSGLKDWSVSGPGSVTKSALGDSYFSVNAPAGQDALLISPTFPVGTDRVLHLQFSYRSSVAQSGPDHGSWVFVNFITANGQPAGRETVVCEQATDWTPVDTRINVPANTATVQFQFRVQQTGGQVDWREVSAGFEPVAAVVDPSSGWKLVDSFTLDPASGDLKSASGAISPTGSGVPNFVLPNRDVGSEDLAYDIDVSVRPGWGASTGIDDILALGDNISQPAQPGSMVLTILGGKNLLSRINGSVSGSADVGRSDVGSSPDATTNVRVWFAPRNLTLFYNGVKAGSTDLPGVPFSWPKGRPLFVGGSAARGLLHGQIVALTLKVYAPVLRARFAGGLDGGYFEAGGAKSWAIEFPDQDGQQISDEAEIRDLTGGTVAHLKPVDVSASRHDFQIPQLPCGWYALAAKLTGKDGSLEKEHSFCIVQPFTRVPAEQSPFGDTTEFSLPANVFDAGYVKSVFQRCAAGGIRWFRLWLRWDDIETQKGVYNWGSLDQVVDLAQQNGLTLYVCITGGTAPFQSGDKASSYGRMGLMTSACFMPEDMEAWKAFLGAMAARYQGKIGYYQIWNEPDAKNGFSPFDPKAYAEVVRESSKVLRAGAPGVKIGLGGFVAMIGEGGRRASFQPSDSAWADKAFYDLKPGPTFDIVDGHFYSIGEPSQSWDRNLPAVRDARAFLSEVGLGDKPVWNSETSMYSGPVGQRGGWGNVPFLSEAGQAIALVQFEVQSLAAGVQRSFWYGFRGYIGFVNDDFSPKPAYPALVNTVRLFQDSHYVRDEDDGPKLRVYRFQRGNDDLLAVWTTSGSTPLTVSGSGFRLVDMMGNETTPAGSLVEATKTPQFLLGSGHLEVAPIVVLDFPVQAEGAPVTGKVAVRNPSDQATRFTIVASLPGGTSSTKQGQLAPGASDEVPFTLSGTGQVVQVAVRAEGGIQHDMSLSQALEFQRQAILSSSAPAELTIDQASQVVLGGAALDPQNRVLSASRWQGPGDLSGRAKLTLEGDKLHFEVQVHDDVVMAATGDRQLYEGDAVEFFLDHGDKSFQAVVSADGRVKFYRGDAASSGFEVTVAKTPDGYTESGSFLLPEGRGSRFDLALDDADDSSGRKVQMTWSGNTPDFSRPEKFGLLSRP